MSDWLISIADTQTGARIAVFLALLGAVMHAAFGAIQKGRHDPWLTRGAIDLSYGLIAVPLVFLVPFPEPHMWSIFVGMFVIHVIYKYVQGSAYQHGAYTVVYPVARGLGPLLTVLAASIVFSESYTWVQWAGVLLLSLSIFSLSFLNWRRSKDAAQNIAPALIFAVASGVMVAVYTTYDAFGIRSSADPFTFLVWFFLIDGLLVFPWVALVRWLRIDNPPDPGPLLLRGLAGGLIAYFSFGAVMLATRIDRVGEAAVLRETSPIFAALIGWFVLKESVGYWRAGLMGLIAVGAIVVELGG
ncbi:MAG: EamA family transporter [Pseudomonadota bacterium]